MNRDLIVDNIKLAINSVRAQRLRTWLTALIISFGIMALVGILSATDAITQSLEGNFSSLGANTFTIRSNNAGFRIGHRGTKPKIYKKFTFDEAMSFQERFNYQSAQVSIAFAVTGTAEIKHGSKKTDPNVLVWGIDRNYFNTAGYEFDSGRNFSSVDIDEGRPVAIIGQDIANALFEGKDPLGKVISISGKRYLVVGLLAEKGSSGFLSGDRVVFVPITNARNYLARTSPSYAISIMAPNGDLLDACQQEAIATMRAVRKLRPKEENNCLFWPRSEIQGGHCQLQHFAGQSL